MSAAGTKQIKVDAQTHALLQKLKAVYGVKSFDEVIQRAVSDAADDEPSSESDGSAADSPREPLQKRKKLVRPALVSFDKMAERDGMLRFETGLDEGAIRLVMERLREVRRCPLFFSLAPSSRCRSLCVFPTSLFDRWRRLTAQRGGKATMGTGSWISRIVCFSFSAVSTENGSLRSWATSLGVGETRRVATSGKSWTSSVSTSCLNWCFCGRRMNCAK